MYFAMTTRKPKTYMKLVSLSKCAEHKFQDLNRENPKVNLQHHVPINANSWKLDSFRPTITQLANSDLQAAWGTDCGTTCRGLGSRWDVAGIFCSCRFRGNQETVWQYSRHSPHIGWRICHHELGTICVVEVYRTAQIFSLMSNFDGI